MLIVYVCGLQTNLLQQQVMCHWNLEPFYERITNNTWLGPVSALTTNDAKILIAVALKNLAGQPVVIDILQDKDILSNW